MFSAVHYFSPQWMQNLLKAALPYYCLENLSRLLLWMSSFSSEKGLWNFNCCGIAWKWFKFRD